jgi:hypothetical protein
MKKNLEITIFKTDGTGIVKKFANSPTLKEMQEMVGGYIQLIPMQKTQEFMVVNEDGLPNGLPYNKLAQIYLHRNAPNYADNNIIVGDVFLINQNLVQ